ncbi:MAG: c-type cytochrome [Gammaproteobacteria bacterium]|jgi:mono/diheme cytochrome c family protein
MKSGISLTAIVMTACILATPAFADLKGDVAKGKALYEGKCMACHVSMTGGDGSLLFTRSDRKIHSLDGLKTQVQRCATNTNTQWFPEEIDDVVKYLNTEYYHFATK